MKKKKKYGSGFVWPPSAPPLALLSRFLVPMIAVSSSSSAAQCMVMAQDWHEMYGSGFALDTPHPTPYSLNVKSEIQIFYYTP